MGHHTNTPATTRLIPDSENIHFFVNATFPYTNYAQSTQIINFCKDFKLPIYAELHRRRPPALLAFEIMVPHLSHLLESVPDTVFDIQTSLSNVLMVAPARAR